MSGEVKSGGSRFVDFIDWCDRVLDKVVEVTAASLDARTMGVESNQQLPSALFGEDAPSKPEFHLSKARFGMYDALNQLVDCYLVQEHGMFYKPTDLGERVAEDKSELWEAFCKVTLKPEQEQVLRAVNRLSPHEADDHAWLERVGHTLLSELGWASDRDGPHMLWAVATELEQKQLVGTLKAGGTIELEATYRGLVWEQRRGITVESRAIDSLVAEWETTSVEFKRELHTDTADEKAELIKDVIALANTQASGHRWLIIGFDDKTRKYHDAPDPKITQEHLEQLMSQYTDPVVEVRYVTVAYRLEAVGKIEVLRDPKKLPYRVAKSIGHKKRIEQGDVFVRYSSLSERPTAGELLAIMEK